MKKITKFIFIAIFIMIIGIGCSADNLNNENPHEKELEESPSSHFVSTVDLNSLDNLIKYAHTIVHGTVSSVEPFHNEGTNEYVIKVYDEFKMDMDEEEIFVYEQDGSLELGESYLLFLSSFDGGLFPHTTYTSINKEAILKIESNDLSHHSVHLSQDMKLDETLKEITNSPNLANQPQQEKALLLSNASQSELIDQADVISQITPVRFTHENKYMKVAEVKVNQTHKGHLETGDIVHLPASVELDKEYLGYFKNDEGMLIVNSIEDSVIDKQDEKKWDEAIKILDD